MTSLYCGVVIASMKICKRKNSNTSFKANFIKIVVIAKKKKKTTSNKNNRVFNDGKKNQLCFCKYCP